MKQEVIILLLLAWSHKRRLCLAVGHVIFYFKWSLILSRPSRYNYFSKMDRTKSMWSLLSTCIYSMLFLDLVFKHKWRPRYPACLIWGSRARPSKGEGWSANTANNIPIENICCMTLHHSCKTHSSVLFGALNESCVMCIISHKRDLQLNPDNILAG